jgi:hypothetical protein
MNKQRKSVKMVWQSRFDQDDSYKWCYVQFRSKHQAIYRGQHKRNSVLRHIQRLRWTQPKLSDWANRDFLKVLMGWQSFKSILQFKKTISTSKRFNR